MGKYIAAHKLVVAIFVIAVIATAALVRYHGGATGLWCFGIAVLVYLAGSSADVYETKRTVVDRPGSFHERNPIAKRILDGFGWRGLAAAKIIVGIAIAIAAGATWGVLGASVALAAVGVLFLWVGYRNMKLGETA